MRECLKLQPEYVKAQEKVIRNTVPYLKSGGSSERIRVVAEYVKDYRSVLNIGCGGYMPLLVRTTHAVDLSDVAGDLLRENGYAGQFTKASCTNLPFRDRSFDCGICSEVIEHQETICQVRATFEEMDRVCRNWILTTPTGWGGDPDHKRVMTEEEIRYFAGMHGAKFKSFKRWWIVWKGGSEPARAGQGVPKGAWHA
jgi:hypothetical protein